MSSKRRAGVRRALAVVLFATAVALGVLSSATSASAQTAPAVPTIAAPNAVPTQQTTDGSPGDPGQSAGTSPTGASAGTGAGVSIDITAPDLSGKGSSNVVILILGIAVLSIAPSLLILLTSFPRIVIILSIARNAVGLPSVPPNQVITGLALFLTIFVMGPTLSQMNEVALQPLLNNEISTTDALKKAETPLREYMLKNTRDAELNLMMEASHNETPVERDNVPLTALIPAFVLSELQTAFMIGFAIFLPFLIIDLIVASVLQSLGLMMLPPTFVSLPFKVMLFVLAGGWTLIVSAILGSFT